ncbi:DNA damage-regulated autophagy modulator protein 2-like [Cylas formicarius]|uniref:DNA damage-regulated autophagy modulator protein 2-like n=1 Tax=Cylas formicarius TaxID=197179 RepID=UPI0029586CD0|nr:DNA damage-regulated autophagy modulator protein 2-like [Cylas formicarius]
MLPAESRRSWLVKIKWKSWIALPTLLGALWFLTLIVCFAWSKSYAHVGPGFPYISDIGAHPPESCLFSLMCNMMTLLVGVIVYIRYRLVRFVCDRATFEEKPTTVKMSKISVVAGFLAVAFLLIYSNFQKIYMPVAQAMGTLGAIICLLVYQWSDSVVSLHVYPAVGSKRMIPVRFGIAFLCSITFILALTYSLMTYLNFGLIDWRHWSKYSSEYASHLVAAVAEWITSILAVSYFISFAQEFKHLEFAEPPIGEKCISHCP